MIGAVKLLPCPFCRSATIEFDPILFIWVCQDCYVEGPAEDDEAGTLWNTRPPDPAVASLEAEVARLHEELRQALERSMQPSALSRMTIAALKMRGDTP